jgi:hypothetical protein
MEIKIILAARLLARVNPLPSAPVFIIKVLAFPDMVHVSLTGRSLSSQLCGILFTLLLLIILRAYSNVEPYSLTFKPCNNS